MPKHSLVAGRQEKKKSAGRGVAGQNNSSNLGRSGACGKRAGGRGMSRRERIGQGGRKLKVEIVEIASRQGTQLE